MAKKSKKDIDDKSNDYARLRAALAEGGTACPEAITALLSERDRLLEVATLAKKAQWLHAACYDLADGSGCFISTDSMARFDEVFDKLGFALGDLVHIDDEEEAELFNRPFARAEKAEAERDALRAELDTLKAKVDAAGL